MNDDAPSCDRLMTALDPPPGGLDAATAAHVATCPVCRARGRGLARAILSTLEAPISCAECRGRMPALRSAAGARLDARLSEAAAHVEACVDCRATFVALTQAMADLESGVLPAAARPPEISLDFLDSAPMPSAWRPDPSNGDAGGSTIRTTVAEIVIRLRRRGAVFGPLPAPLAPAPLPAAAWRDPSADSPQQLALGDPDSGIEIALVVGPVVAARAVIDVVLRSIGDRSPIADTRVVLYDPAARPLASTVSDGDGRVRFADVGPGRYLCEVRRPERRWRLPLAVEIEASVDR